MAFLTVIALTAALTSPLSAIINQHQPTPSNDSFYIYEEVSERKYLETGEIEATFYGKAWDLAPGQVVFTNPDTTKIPMPPGKYAITSVIADIVDDNKKPVPLSEVYMHHWAFLDHGGNSGVCPGFLGEIVFVAGAESRLTSSDFLPWKGQKFGWFASDKSVFTANIHVLRTVDIDPEKGGVKGCIECHGPNKYCKMEGGFDCCPDGSFCPVIATSKTPKKHYSFQYKMKYYDLTKTTDVRPADYFILDASPPRCTIEYNIKANPTLGYNRQVTTFSNFPHDAEFFHMWGHIHFAGYNISLYHDKTANDASKIICTSYPTYGTHEGQVGNEKNYLTRMSKCMFKEPYVIKKGDSLTLEVFYNVGETDQRTIFGPGLHDSVMGLWYMPGVSCKTAGCTGEESVVWDVENASSKTFFLHGDHTD